MTTPRPAKQVADPREARIWAALEIETPIQHVTIDEASEPSHSVSAQVQTLEDKDGSVWRRARREVGKRKCTWLFVILAVVSVTLGTVLPQKNSSSPHEARIDSLETFKSRLPAYSLNTAQTNASSPQAKALAWLQNDSDYELYRLNQRYALGVLYYSTNMGNWSGALSWMSDTNECTWGPQGQICDESSRLLTLSFSEDDLVGLVPKELELLTDLQTLQFSRGGSDALSCPIYSEMYVPETPCVSIFAHIALLIVSVLVCLCFSGKLSKLDSCVLSCCTGAIPTEVYVWFNIHGLTPNRRPLMAGSAVLLSCGLYLPHQFITCFRDNVHDDRNYVDMPDIRSLDCCYSGRLTRLKLLYLDWNQNLLPRIPTEVYVDSRKVGDT
jgi:hypothetical protein